MKVLIAEDDFTSRNLLTIILEKYGYEVIATCDGLEAWDEMSKPDAPSIVVLDWMMPEMDGLELTKRIRSLDLALPPYILMLTAKGAKKDILAGLNAGANDYLTKPYDPEELSARLNVGRRIVELESSLHQQITELKNALAEIKTLRGIVPICASCKKIRNDNGYWEQVEIYVREHSEAQFSHGICPECMVKLYPEFVGNKETKRIKDDDTSGK